METTLEPQLIEALNRFRGDPPGSSACAAPWVNMHFSQMGVVSACCFNRTHVLGVYPRDSIDQIWQGGQIKSLREAMDRYDLSVGCEKCVQTMTAGDLGGTHAVFYSIFTRLAERQRVEWGMPKEGDPDAAPLPMRLEFNIHNSCNLRCVMCHGLASSAIRTQREGLAPIANPYDERFVEQLAPYFKYVIEADFMGGEPFLIPVYTMLWERIAAENPKMKVCILSNGTILDDRIKRMLESFNAWMHVSIDSVFKETYENIRRGASYEVVMENCDWYNALMKKRGYPFVYRFCPMRLNWREIPATIDHCNERGIILSFNQLDSPVNLSLATLPQPELRSVVSFLEKNFPTDDATDIEKQNQTNYAELVQRLQGFVEGKNRVQGLQARLDTASAVLNNYLKGTDEKRSRRMTVPLLDEEKDAIHQAAARFLITRINLDQALGAGLDVPENLVRKVDDAMRGLKGLMKTADRTAFVRTYLGDLIRTYSGVWGVPDRPHTEDAFDRVAEVSSLVAGREDSIEVVESLIDAPVAGVYQAFAHCSVDDILARIERKEWEDLRAERLSLDVVDRELHEAGERGELVQVEPAKLPEREKTFAAAAVGAPVPGAMQAASKTRVRTAAHVVGSSGNGDGAGPGQQGLAYRARVGESLPVRMEFSVTPKLKGADDLIDALRSENVLLTIDSVRITGRGRRLVTEADGAARRIDIDFDHSRVEGTRNGEPFAFEFERGRQPPDLAEDPLKAVCWALSMGGRRYRLGTHGDYLLVNEDEDAQMEAMSRIIDAPVWLPEDQVSPGAEWRHEWSGAFEHRDNGGRINYCQSAWLQSVDEAGRRASITSATTGKLVAEGHRADGAAMLFEAMTSVTLDSKEGSVLAADSTGTVASVFPNAGFEIVWNLNSKVEIEA